MIACKHSLIIACLWLPLLIWGQKTTAVIDQWIDKAEDENYTARHECSFVQAGDEFILFGGRESAQKLDIYDFKNNSWRVGSRNAPKEFNHFQATFYKGFVWIIGSFKTNAFPKELPEENIWLYHPVTEKWIKGPEIPAGRRRGGAGLVVYNNKFYLLGGNTIGHNGGFVNWFDEYDPYTNTWTVLEDAVHARDHFQAVVIDHTLYAVAGRQSGGSNGVFKPLIQEVELYEFQTKSWSILENDLPTPRAAPCAVFFNGELLVIGGEGETKGPAYKLVEALDLETKTWSRKADMKYSRHGTQAILSGKGIYLAAGSPLRGGGNQLNMEVYNVDKPKGKALVASSLKGPKRRVIKQGSTSDIIIKNKQGNTGSFIDRVSLSGPDKDQFTIQSSPAWQLIDAKGKLTIKVQHKGQAAGAEADLTVIYNGNKELVIKLLSK